MRPLKTLIAESTVPTTGGGTLGIIVGIIFTSLFHIQMPVRPPVLTSLTVLMTIIGSLFATCLISNVLSISNNKKPTNRNSIRCAFHFKEANHRNYIKNITEFDRKGLP